MHYFYWSVFGFISFIPGVAQADTPDSLFSVDVGTAGVSRAHADSPNVVRHSPAMMSLVSRYQLETMAYFYESLDWGMGISAFDSTQGPVSLGFTYVREKNEAGLGSDYLPGWRYPEEELEEFSIDSILG